MFKFATNTLSIPKIWAESFSLYKQTLLKIWYLVLAMQLIIKALGMPISIALMNPQFGDSKLFMLYINYMFWIISPVIYILSVSTIFHRMYYVAENANYRLVDSLKYIFSSRMIKILATMIIVILGVLLLNFFVGYLGNEALAAVTAFSKYLYALGWLIAFLALISYCLLFFPVLFFILFKDAGVMSSIKQSLQLTMGNLWRNFVVFLLPVVGFILVNIGVFLLFRLLAFHIQTSVVLIAFSLFNLLLVIILLPYIKSVFLVQFNDLLLRRKMV